jgi:hypothetical protein
MTRQCPGQHAARISEIARTAERTSRDMLGRVAGSDEATTVTIDVPSFRAIATMLGVMAAEALKCGGEDCMGRAVDGVRLWVTKDRFDQLSARARQNQDEVARLAEELKLAELQSLDSFPSWSKEPAASPRSSFS